MVVDMHGLDIPQEIKQTSESQAILERCLPWLLKSYSNQSIFKTLKLPQDMFDYLVKHPRYSMCMLIIKDMFPYWPIHRQHWPLIGPTLIMSKMIFLESDFFWTLDL